MNNLPYTLSQASHMLQSGECSAVELTQAFLERIERMNPLLNCYLTVTADSARESARQADAVRSSSPGSGTGSVPSRPLLGLPLALKDLFETAGVLTTDGARVFAAYVPQTDSAVVTRLKEAGAVLLGKLNMHEIALGVTNVNPHYGACRNPWDTTRITGGSSGGSAAALASGLCLGSLGSDTGGSIRIPASLCGVVGLKPTYGRVSLRGVIPLSWNLDHAGPLANCVEDVARLLQVIAGYDPEDPASAPSAPPLDSLLLHLNDGVRDWRVAVADDEYFQAVDAPVLDAFDTAAQVFADLGARVERVPFLEARNAALANGLLVQADAAAFHSQRLAERPQDFGEDVRFRLETGAAYSSTEYAQARHTQSLLRRQFERFFDEWDILLTPATPTPAPLIEGQQAVEQARRLTRFTAPFNLTGLPALVLPAGFSPAGLPIGLQIISRPWAEASVLQAAYAYEQATGWHTRQPILDID